MPNANQSEMQRVIRKNGSFPILQIANNNSYTILVAYTLSFSELDIKNANHAAKQIVGIDFADIRKLYFSVMLETMNIDEIQVLNGKASFEAAGDCLKCRVDPLAEKYCRARDKFGLVLPVL